VLLGAAFAAVDSARGAGSATQIVFAADRRPALGGEIYRVDMDGKRVDLSRSPYRTRSRPFLQTASASRS
jgi:hypothetical protein